MLNSKDIEQKAKEFLAERGITNFARHETLDYTTTTDLLDYLEQFGATILTTACQQAQGGVVLYEACNKLVADYELNYNRQLESASWHNNNSDNVGSITNPYAPLPVYDEKIKAIKDALQPLPTAPAEKKLDDVWVSVSDTRKPPIDKAGGYTHASIEVTGLLKNDKETTCYYHFALEKWYDMSCMNTVEITHWKPI